MQLYEPFLASLAARGIEVVYGAIEPRLKKHAVALGFFPLAEVAVRSLYLGLGLRAADGRSRLVQSAARDRARGGADSYQAGRGSRRRREPPALRPCACAAERRVQLRPHEDEGYLRWRHLEDPRGSHRFFVHRRRAGLGSTGSSPSVWRRQSEVESKRTSSITTRASQEDAPMRCFSERWRSGR